MNAQEAKKLEENIKKQIFSQVKKSQTVILGLSGGPDSVFLLHILNLLHIKTVAAHVDHCIRKQSKKDRQFCQEIAQDNIYEEEICDIKELSETTKKGLEETGREVRYKFFEKLAKKHKATTIITAHHADDNLETIIFNFTRGTTIKGLIGIETISKTNQGTTLSRPLLEITKDEILAYLKLKNIDFCIDKTNKDTKYKRNLIRELVIPQLKKINENIAKTTATNTQNLKEINDFIKETAEKYTKKMPIDAKVFRTLPTAIKNEIIHSIYKKNLSDTKKLKAVNVNEVVKMIDQNIGNKHKKLGEVIFSLKNNQVSVEKILKKSNYKTTK